MTQRFYSPRYDFAAQTPCYCNSGRAFGSCCGSTDHHREAPAGIQIVPDFISRDEREDTLRFAEQQHRDWLLVAEINEANGQQTGWKRDPGRVTQYVDMADRKPLMAEWMLRAVQQHVQPRTGMAIERFEEPCMLRYTEGGLYGAHVDGEAFDETVGQWYRAIDRDISLLIYLNDDYAGGGLMFNNLNYTYQPRAGDLVFFPSNNIFRHESLTITSGIKYALVTWSMAVGTPRVGTT